MAHKTPDYWLNLDPKKVMEYVNWALDNWEPNTKINHTWHQIIQNTWGKLDASYATARTQILADWEQALSIHKEES